jgi:hypothetical protein
MPPERNQRPHRDVELAQALGTPEIGQVDDEAGSEHFRAELTQ